MESRSPQSGIVISDMMKIAHYTDYHVGRCIWDQKIEFLTSDVVDREVGSDLRERRIYSGKFLN